MARKKPTTTASSKKASNAIAEKKAMKRAKEMGLDFANLDQQFFKKHGISISEYIDRQRTFAAHSAK
jgi:hypothetical protein